MEKQKVIDHRWTDTVICPYCGADNGGDDGDGPPKGEQQCHACQKRFDCEPDYSVTYTTSKVPCWNGEPHKWGKPFPISDDRGIHHCAYCNRGEWVDIPAPSDQPMSENN